MKVYVNAVSIREGGPRVVLVKLLTALLHQYPALKIRVAASPNLSAEMKDLPASMQPVVVGQSPLTLAKWYEWNLARSANEWSADVIFSVTNYLPLRRLDIPTLLLEQHAGHFSPVFDRLMHAPAVPVLERLVWDMKTRWVRRSVESATVLTVQTAVLADAIAAVTRVARDAIRVIPHGPGWAELRSASPPALRDPRRPFRIGYIAKPGVQKNFTTLLHAVKKMSERGKDIRLVLTLDPAISWTTPILAEAESLGVARLIENRGETGPVELTDVYDGLDVFVFPSLCESFGMPMAEAMARGLCVVVADTPENREIVGPAGLFFPATQAEDLAALLERLYDDEQEVAKHASMSLRRAGAFSWQSAAELTFEALGTAADAR